MVQDMGTSREWQDHKASDRPLALHTKVGSSQAPPQEAGMESGQTLTLPLPQESLGPALELAFPSLVNASISHFTGLLEK